MSLKPWREIAVPHEDVLKGTFQQAEFAADLSRVHDGTATDEYQKPALFFERTFITEGMRLLFDNVIKRLTGKGGDPVIQLQTAFGGGKTHTMLAIYHLAKGEVSPNKMQGIPAILEAAAVKVLPKACIAVLDGTRLSPGQPAKRGGVKVHTMWGELAWQLGGDAAYARVKEADVSGTSPGKEVLAKLLADHSPCIVLVDELVAYLRQFEEGKSYTGGTYDSNLTFVQSLTEALKAVPTAVLLASLPESDKEAGSQRGINALRALEHYFARVQALWKPVATEEAFHIVRRRLFSTVSDKLGSETVCRAFADYYVAGSGDFPHDTQESRYFDRLNHAYPIHPEVFDRLYEDWSSLESFQRTRGVLKLMAKVIHRLWNDNNRDLLIMPGSLPLYDADVRNEAIYYLPQGWDPVIERDVDGERSEPAEIDGRDTRLGSVQAARRVGRTIFLGSAPSVASQVVRGLELERVILGCAQPGQAAAVYKDALHRLTERLHYLNSANNRFWFDTRANLRREMEERKRRYQDKEDVLPAIRERIGRVLASGLFGGTHVFTPSGDVPDDWQLRLVVLPPDAPYRKTGANPAVERATETLRSRGDQPRQRQNRLIFLAADPDVVTRLRDQVRAMLAWQSIVEDARELKLNLDKLQERQAVKSLEDAQNVVQRVVRETYKSLLAPMQEARPGKGLSDIQWESFQVSASAANLTQEIERILQENELLITEWSPIHLRNVLQNWYWKDGNTTAGALAVWQDSCRYLYLPRLKDDSVYRNTLAAGADSSDYFGFAYGRNGEKFEGFTFGRTTSPILDDALLLIEPTAASAYADKMRAEVAAAATGSGVTYPAPGTGATAGEAKESQPAGSPTSAPTKGRKRSFYGVVNLDPIRAKVDFAQIVDEVIQHFTARPDAKVSISIEIRADSGAGFDDTVQRAVKENCKVLRFRGSEFEDGE